MPRLILAIAATTACHSPAPIHSNPAAQPTPANRSATSSAARSSSLPSGVVEDCFLPRRCDATGDLDADGLPDRVALVARADERGFAVFWGTGAPPTLIG